MLFPNRKFAARLAVSTLMWAFAPVVALGSERSLVDELRVYLDSKLEPNKQLTATYIKTRHSAMAMAQRGEDARAMHAKADLLQAELATNLMAPRSLSVKDIKDLINAVSSDCRARIAEGSLFVSKDVPAIYGLTEKTIVVRVPALRGILKHPDVAYVGEADLVRYTSPSSFTVTVDGDHPLNAPFKEFARFTFKVEGAYGDGIQLYKNVFGISGLRQGRVFKGDGDLEQLACTFDLTL